MFQHMTTPKSKDSINELKRNESATIFRLRTQHVPLNSHLYWESESQRTAPVHSARVPMRQWNIISLNVLLGLIGLISGHNIYPPNPTIENTLYTHSEQLGKTHTYFVMSWNGLGSKYAYRNLFFLKLKNSITFLFVLVWNVQKRFLAAIKKIAKKII